MFCEKKISNTSSLLSNLVTPHVADVCAAYLSSVDQHAACTRRESWFCRIASFTRLPSPCLPHLPAKPRMQGCIQVPWKVAATTTTAAKCTINRGKVTPSAKFLFFYFLSLKKINRNFQTFFFSRFLQKQNPISPSYGVGNRNFRFPTTLW